MAELCIRPAGDAEARAGRMLLPAMFRPEQAAPEMLLAWRGDTLAGAVAMGTVLLPGGAGFLVDAHVVPQWRRRGVGRALLAAAADRARGRAPGLRARVPVPADGPEAAFLFACGFEAAERVLHFETDTADFLAAMAARRARLEQRGRVPPGARVVRLRDAPAEQVAALVAAHFPTAPFDVLRRLQPLSDRRFDLDNSVALLLDGRVRAALVFDWAESVPVIQVRVVDPALRGGWANVLILEAATRNGYTAGSTRFRFFAETDVADTMKLAARAGAVQTGTELVMVRRLGGPNRREETVDLRP